MHTVFRVTRRLVLVTLSVLTLVALCIGVEALIALVFSRGNFLRQAPFAAPQLTILPSHTETRDERGFILKTNNYSMRRDTDISEKPAHGVTRILSYGDSITRGFGLDVESTYSFRLERELTTSLPGKFEVLNMLRGSSPTLQSFHLREDLPQFTPHMVLMETELLNDLSDEALISVKSWTDDGFPEKIAGGRYLRGWNGQRLLHVPILPGILEGSATANLLRTWTGKLWYRFLPNPLFSPESGTYLYHVGSDRNLITSRKIEASFSRMFDVIERSQTLAHDSGAAFLLLLLPSSYAFYSNRYQKETNRLFERAEVEAKTRNISFLSLKGTFEEYGGKELFQDFCHPTSRGNEIIATAVAGWFRTHCCESGKGILASERTQ